MRLHRFYINKPIEGENVEVKDEELLHQWRNVFRYNTGSEIVLFDGSGFEFYALIEKLSNREAELRVVSKKEGIVPKNKITLYQSLIKKDKMEWVVEKATELGVSKIVPLLSERSEKKGFNIERARKIAVEASEQCGRTDVPKIGEVIQLNEAIEKAENAVVFDKNGIAPPPNPLPEGEGVPKETSIFIGSEGGWSEKELNLFKQKGAEILSLGPLTLRAETAAVVAIARMAG
jgi:16S rRNA (uracil1498-N3)-methyltransferase